MRVASRYFKGPELLVDYQVPIRGGKRNLGDIWVILELKTPERTQSSLAMAFWLFGFDWYSRNCEPEVLASVFL